MKSLATLPSILTNHAARHPDRVAYRFVDMNGVVEGEYSYLEVYRAAVKIAALLHDLRHQGRTVILLYPTGIDFVVAFYGCMLAGAIAVPCNLPRVSSGMQRLASILSDTGATLILTTQRLAEKVAHLSQALPVQPKVVATDALEKAFVDLPLPLPNGSTIAMLQYTSGSTAHPKGVKITHENFVANARMMAQASALTSDSIGVNWLPLHHDMGLMGGVIQAVATLMPLTLIQPTHFLARPQLWLEVISRYQATATGAPNFAFDHCVDRIPEDAVEGLDLACWSIAYTGAEPIRAHSLQRFGDRFHRFGFRDLSFFPCYGLAEATLIVTGGPVQDRYKSLELDRVAVSRGEVLPSRGASTLTVVSSGLPVEGLDIAIVDPISCSLLDDTRIGEIWVRGESVSPGYWNWLPEDTAALFEACTSCGRGPFLRTGDLGFINSGELYVVGRKKDLIIVRGNNHHPEDLEYSVSMSHASLRAGSCAAFVCDNGKEEQIVVVQEMVRGSYEAASDAVLAIRHALSLHHGIAAATIVLTEQGYVKKTSSGKIQRWEMKKSYLQNDLRVIIEAEMDAGRSVLGANHTEDVGDILRMIWISTIGITQVDVDQNFFDLGGQSIHLAQIHEQINARLGVEIAIEDLFQYPTISALSRFIREGRLSAGNMLEGKRRSQRGQSYQRSAERRSLHRERSLAKNSADGH